MRDLKAKILLFTLRYVLIAIGCLHEIRERLYGWRIELNNRRIDLERKRRR